MKKLKCWKEKCAKVPEFHDSENNKPVCRNHAWESQYEFEYHVECPHCVLKILV